MTAVLVERESIQNTILDSGIDHNFVAIGKRIGKNKNNQFVLPIICYNKVCRRMKYGIFISFRCCKKVGIV